MRGITHLLSSGIPYNTYCIRYITCTPYRLTTDTRTPVCILNNILICKRESVAARPAYLTSLHWKKKHKKRERHPNNKSKMSESFQFMGGERGLRCLFCFSFFYFILFFPNQKWPFSFKIYCQKIITQLEDFVYAKSDGSLLPFSRMDPVSAKRKKGKKRKKEKKKKEKKKKKNSQREIWMYVLYHIYMSRKPHFFLCLGESRRGGRGKLFDAKLFAPTFFGYRRFITAIRIKNIYYPYGYLWYHTKQSSVWFFQAQINESGQMQTELQ